MPYRYRSTKQATILRRSSALLLASMLSFAASNLVACGDSKHEPTIGAGSGTTGGAGGGSATETGTGGSSTVVIGSGIGGSGFNQCGVAAPMPAHTGRCTVVSAPAVTNFDDYTGTAAGNYTYYVNANPPASDAVLGAFMHIGDGSNADDGGTSVISVDMVTGEGGAGYALQFSNTNATHWGGLLMFYFPNQGCLEAQGYGGLAFSIKGTSPSGNFGVNLGMLDTISTSDNGLCASTGSNDCKDANVHLSLPADAETWKEIQIPWSAFTPGVGGGLSCVPVTGQNIVRLVIQPFMKYPPPNYTMEPGPYKIAVDDVRFY